MITLLVYIIFIFSIAFTASGVILSTRLRNRFGPDLFSTLLYYQVFIYAFGFYGIWGNIAIKSFLTGLVSDTIIARFLNISLLLGIPFLLFGWMMLLRFAAEISGRKKNRWFFLWFLLVNFLILLGLGLIIKENRSTSPDNIIRYYFITLCMIYAILFSFIIILPGNQKSVLQKLEARIISFSIVVIAALQSISLFFLEGNSYIGLAFIFLFFSGNSFLPLYLSYGTILSIFREPPGKNLSFEDFCRKFEISPRESEIIQEICNGLTNQEISDRLFISLQTVKDHTHRIYIKTNAKNRVQLINLVKDAKSS
jgi:DNA-binding CsgD family transcriptional regulator